MMSFMLGSSQGHRAGLLRAGSLRPCPTREEQRTPRRRTAASDGRLRFAGQTSREYISSSIEHNYEEMTVVSGQQGRLLTGWAGPKLIIGPSRVKLGLLEQRKLTAVFVALRDSLVERCCMR
ncbi:hypothetical protein SRHO_G00050680 [Serrasalmus rhombeus]